MYSCRYSTTVELRGGRGGEGATNSRTSTPADTCLHGRRVKILLVASSVPRYQPTSLPSKYHAAKAVRPTTAARTVSTLLAGVPHLYSIYDGRMLANKQARHALRWVRGRHSS